MQGFVKSVKFLIIIPIITFALAEMALRFLGYRPGVHITTRGLKPIDTLKVIPGLSSDQDGIFHYLPPMVSEFRKQKLMRDYNQLPGELHNLLTENFKIENAEIQNNFTEAYQRALKKKPTALSDYDKALLHFVKSPLNDEGFRSIPFKKFQSQKKKILLLGDSFTWGHSAGQMSNSFGDLLLAKGYIVYNAGITGADSAQYLALARKYIPLLKPDVVIVNFFLGNDVAYHKREPLPHMPIFFSTNAGNLYSFTDGVYLNSAELRYNFILRNYRIPVENNWFNKISAQSCIGTLFWKALLKRNLVDAIPREDIEYWKQSAKVQIPEPSANVEMEQVKQIAEGANSKFLLVTITDFLDTPLIRTPDHFHKLFPDIKFYSSPVDVSGYDMVGGHFNVVGHRKYSEYLLGLIEGNGP